MLILNHGAVMRALSPTDCIDAVATGLREHAADEQTLFPRHQLRAGPDDALLGLMPVASRRPERLWGLKAVLVAAGNRARGLDSHQGAILLHDAETGVPLALVDATAITALRTAAASAVATAVLARPGARRVAILGGGTQARSHVAAIRLVVPDAEIRLWARSDEHAVRLARELDIEPVPDPRTAVFGADVVCTVTASSEPIVERAWLAPGVHVNAVGASRLDAREIDSETIGAAEFFVDSRAQAEVECGEYLIPLAEGRITPDHIRAELGAVLIGRHPGRGSETALTVFKSLGIAVEDLAAAARAVERARAAGLGQTVEWGEEP